MSFFSCSWADQERTAEWHCSPETPWAISFQRRLGQSIAPPVASGQDVLRDEQRAHHLEYTIFAWEPVVGVMDASVPFDGRGRQGGRSWGFQVLGCLFHTSRQGFELQAPRGFDTPFNGHNGGCTPQDGFVLELHINWPTRELFVALNRGPYQAVPDLRLPDDVSTLRPWVHANGAHSCLVELVKVEQLEACPPPDRKVRLSALLATPHSHESDSEERSDPPTVKAQRQAPHGCAQTVAHGRRKRDRREAEEAILSREENARQFETEMQEVEEEELGEGGDRGDRGDRGASSASGCLADGATASGMVPTADEPEVKLDDDGSSEALDAAEQREYDEQREKWLSRRVRPSVEASCRTLRHLKQREKEPYLLQAFESSGVRAAVAQLDQLHRVGRYRTALGMLRRVMEHITSPSQVAVPDFLRARASVDGVTESNQAAPHDLTDGGGTSSAGTSGSAPAVASGTYDAPIDLEYWEHVDAACAELAAEPKDDDGEAT